MDVSLSPPWGTAWLIDVDDLPEDEIEEQVAWELQQRLDSPLEEHIYAWHAQDNQAYAVVVRPEMLEFWDRIFRDTGLKLGSITLQAGLVDSSIEAGADLHPLYQLWAERQGFSAPPPPKQDAWPSSPSQQQFDDEQLDEDLDEFGGDDRVEALIPGEEDDEEAEEALEAIFSTRGKEKRRRRRGPTIIFLLVVALLAAVTVQRDLIASYIPGGPTIVKRLEGYAASGVKLGKRAVRKVKREINARRGTKPEPQSEAPTPVQIEEQPVFEEPVYMDDTAAEFTEPVDQGVSMEEPEYAPRGEIEREAPPVEPVQTAPVTRRSSVYRGPMQYVELPPVKPSTGLALGKFYSLAEAVSVDLSSLIIQGAGLRFEVQGEQAGIDEWAQLIGSVPGGGIARVSDPALLAPGVLVEMDLQGVEERSLTREQFSRLVANLGMTELGASLWRTNKAGLDRLFAAFKKEMARPYRISIHQVGTDTYHLVMLP